MSLIIRGSKTLQEAEVETTSRALRVTQRPVDIGLLGSYSKGLLSGTIAAGLSANSPVWSLRWSPANTTLVALVRHIQISIGDLAGFTAGFGAFNLFVARGFTASDTGGNAGTFSGNTGKLRTRFGTTVMSDMRIAGTAALSAGTRTLDSDPLKTLSTSFTATAGNPIPPFDLWRPMPGEWPLVLAKDEGLVIQATAPATGTWQLGVNVKWDEIDPALWED